MFRASVDKFVEQHCSREYARDCDNRRKYPIEAYDALVAEGWFGLTAPEEHGGMAADLMFRAILLEGLSRYSFSLGSLYGLTSWGIDVLIDFGTPAQKAGYLADAIAGRCRFSVSMTEPNAGSDITGIKTRAEDKGDHYLVNGQKVFASAAGSPNNVIILVARTGRSDTDKRHGLTLFLVPNNSPGLELRKMRTLSRRMGGTYECFYTDVKVPKENVIGTVDRGWDVLGTFLIQERIGGAAMYVGNGMTAVNDAVRYAQERVQFGQAIGTFQAIKHMLVDAATELEAARLMTYHAAWLHSRGVPCLKEAAMAKLYASEAGFRAANTGMQVLGGYAQLSEFDMERYWRDAKQNMVSSGTSQIQRTIIGKELGLVDRRPRGQAQ
jgi:alkylation response protein AidB-like acyl-CoA dehydrogenase